VTVGPYKSAEVVTVRSEGRWVEIRHPLSTDVGPTTLSESEQLDAFRGYVADALKDKLMPSWLVLPPKPYAPASDTDEWKAFQGRTYLRIAIEDPRGVLTAERLERAFT